MEAKPRVEVKDFLGISIASAMVSSLELIIQAKKCSAAIKVSSVRTCLDEAW
jgi:hypothetical protein